MLRCGKLTACRAVTMRFRGRNTSNCTKKKWRTGWDLPPNQIVYVLADRPIMIERIWEPIWAIGLLTSDQTHSGLGSTAYTLELTEVEPYEY